MTHAEMVILVRYIAACCPQQKIDTYTPDAWHDLLGDLPLADCREAVKAIARVQPFVAASEIRAAVAAKSAHQLPHSSVCRAANHRECVWSWCQCTCHDRVVTAAPSALAIAREA